jgi:hypothetical protein
VNMRAVLRVVVTLMLVLTVPMQSFAASTLALWESVPHPTDALGNADSTADAVPSALRTGLQPLALSETNDEPETGLAVAHHAQDNKVDSDSIACCFAALTSKQCNVDATSVISVPIQSDLEGGTGLILDVLERPPRSFA